MTASISQKRWVGLYNDEDEGKDEDEDEDEGCPSRVI